MNTELCWRAYRLLPGYVIVPSEPTILAAVVASGVVVAVHDVRRQCGGMCHYVWPFRRQRSSAVSAAPALVCLIAMLIDTGSRVADLEAYMYGGATNLRNRRYRPGLSERNVEIGTEVLTRLGVLIAGRDTGGCRGRKVLFHSGSGETVVARLNGISDAEWYPQLTC